MQMGGNVEMRLGGNFALRIGAYINANIHKILNGAYVAYQNGDEVGERSLAERVLRQHLRSNERSQSSFIQDPLP